MGIRIQFASDLHIDINRSKKKFIEQKGDILCLLGNICSCGSDHGINLLKEFLARECDKFKKIIFIAGNHEFYSNSILSIDEIKIKLKSLEADIKNFIFLDNEILELRYGPERLLFVGSTLWSHIPDHCKKAVKNTVNDYRSINMANHVIVNETIKKFIRHITVEDTQKMHLIAKKFICDSIDYIKNKGNATMILLTHHKPVWDAYSHYNPYTNYAFQSDLGDIIAPPINIAIHGRVRGSYDKIVNGVRILSNPHGYENECAEFDESLCIDLFENEPKIDANDSFFKNIL